MRGQCRGLCPLGHVLEKTCLLRSSKFRAPKAVTHALRERSSRKTKTRGGERDRPNVITDNESVGRKRLPLKRASAHDKPKTWRAKKRCGTADGHVVGVTTSSGLFAHHGVLESLPAVAVTWVCTVVTPFDSMLHQEKLTAWCPRKGVTLTKSVQRLPRHSRVPCRLR